MRYWVVFQRQQTKTESYTAGACAERTLASSNTQNQSLDTSLPRHHQGTKPKDQDVTPSSTLEPFQKPRAHCPGRSRVDAPLPQMVKFQGPSTETCPTSPWVYMFPLAHQSPWPFPKADVLSFGLSRHQAHRLWSGSSTRHLLHTPHSTKPDLSLKK